MSLLACGKLGISPVSIYTVPLKKEMAVITHIKFFNISVLTQTIGLSYTQRNSPSEDMGIFVLNQNQRGEYIDVGDTLEMDIGDSIQAQATTTDSVNFFVFGKES